MAELWNALARPLDLFWGLLGKYVTFGWPFALLHVLVLSLVLRDWLGVRSEIEKLTRWQPGDGTGEAEAQPGDETDEADALAVLQQFVTESKKLGAQGIFVPLTDFSDRLDSFVSGRVTGLYERINLFLIVGIAGTLFGVFEFSFRSASVLGDEAMASSDRATTLGVVLAESLAKAFPVGFVGLLLMFVGQLFVSYYENRLKEAVVRATQKAISRRMEVTTSQAAQMADAVERFAEATAPLANVQATLAQGLEPVARELGGRLEKSLVLVRTQFEDLQRTTGGFASSVVDLRDNVAALGTNTQGLSVVLAEVPPLLGHLTGLHNQQAETLQLFQQNLRANLDATDRTLAAAETAAATARELPAKIHSAAQAALDVVVNDSAASAATLGDYVRGSLQASSELFADSAKGTSQLFAGELQRALDELAKHLRASSGALFSGVTRQTDAMAAALEAGTREVTSVAEAARAAVSGLDGVQAAVTQQLKESLSAVAEEIGHTWIDTTSKLGQASENRFLEFTEKLHAEVRGVSAELTRAAEEWHKVAQNAKNIVHDPIHDLIAKVGADMRQGVRDLEGLIQSYPQAVQDVAALTDGLHGLLERVEVARQGLEQWLHALDRGRTGIERAHAELAHRLATELRPHERSQEVIQLLAEIRNRLEPRRVEAAGPGRRPSPSPPAERPPGVTTPGPPPAGSTAPAGRPPAAAGTLYVPPTPAAPRPSWWQKLRHFVTGR